uniref:Uncharacterized protein n=1 Tax=Plectus sambesii TaxID=2011161 RepID=A0A914XL96_9BILA
MVIFILRLVNSGDEAHDRALIYIFIFVLLATIPLAAVGLIVDVQWYSYVHAKNGAQCICCCDPWPEGTTTEGQRGAVSGGFSTNGATHSNGHDHRVIEAPAEEIPIQQFSRF